MGLLPNSFDSIIHNFKTILIDHTSDLGPNLELIKKTENRTFTNFAELVAKTEELFFCFLEKSSLSDKKNEYVAGRISVRLERIAQSQYGLSIEKSHQIMRPFMEKIHLELKKHLPANTIYVKPAELQDRNNKEKPPFFQEAQQKIMSCQLHAFNTALGYPAADLNSPEFLPFNIDMEGIEWKIINRVATKNALLLPLAQFKNEKLYENYPAFIASNNVHTFTYRKDQNGQWWKVDSLYKVSEWTYQIPVNLLEEKEGWVAIRIVVEDTLQLKELLKTELTELSKRLAGIQEKHLTNQETVDTTSLRNDITSCLQPIYHSANFCRLEEIHTEQSLIDDHLTLLQGTTRDENKLLETIMDINVAIKSKNINVEQFKSKFNSAQIMIANALRSLDN